MIKAEFSASLLQSSVSHDPSEIILISWFDAQENYYYYQCRKQLCCLGIVAKKDYYIYILNACVSNVTYFRWRRIFSRRSFRAGLVLSVLFVDAVMLLVSFNSMQCWLHQQKCEWTTYVKNTLDTLFLPPCFFTPILSKHSWFYRCVYKWH